MKLPDFLVIGAMKCGTTTLFRDLESHPRVFMPHEKEPHALVTDEVLTDAGLARYAALFKPAREDQLAGEASTGYTKLPWETGATERARRVLRPDLKLIYILRDPIDRIISHHFHQYAAGRTGWDIAKTIAADARLIDYSRYAMQLEPWLEAYGPAQVRVVRFEDYITRRASAAGEIFAWMGLDPAEASLDASATHNRGDTKLVAGPFRAILKSEAYQRYARRAIPPALKRAAQRVLFRRAPERPGPPSPELAMRLLDELAPDLARLSELLGLDKPMWEVEALRRRHAGPGSGDVRP